MKKVLFLTVGAMMLSVGCTKKELDLSKDEQKSSYAIGLQVGQNLKQQNIEVSSEALAAGIQDAVSGKEKLSKEEVQKALMSLQQGMTKKMQEQAAKNKEESNKFLEANKAKQGVLVTKSGLQYTVEKEGAGKSPVKESTVKVHYKGTLTNGTEFDSSYKRNKPAEFKVSQVIPGWSEALLLMKPGSKLKLVVPPELAYGPSPRPGIPANSTLLFEVELIEVK